MNECFRGGSHERFTYRVGSEDPRRRRAPSLRAKLSMGVSSKIRPAAFLWQLIDTERTIQSPAPRQFIQEAGACGHQPKLFGYRV